MLVWAIKIIFKLFFFCFFLLDTYYIKLATICKILVLFKYNIFIIYSFCIIKKLIFYDLPSIHLTAGYLETNSDQCLITCYHLRMN